MTPQVWLITGCSSGFGHELVLEILHRGHNVIATARNTAKIEDLEAKGASVLQLDVTADTETIRSLVAAAFQIHQRIDVLVNNAGYVSMGAVEETIHDETLKQFNTNLFGPLNLVRAVAPYMREQHSGVIANFSSMAAWEGLPGCGLYCASKAAVSCVSESLRVELAEFGISVTAIEPGYFRSNLLNTGARSPPPNRIAAYGGTVVRKAMRTYEQANGRQPGDIRKGVRILVDVLSHSGSAEGREIPPRLILGSDAYHDIQEKCYTVLSLLDEWKEVTTATDFEQGA